MVDDLSPQEQLAALRITTERLSASAKDLREIVSASEQILNRSQELLARLDEPERGSLWRYDSNRLSKTLRRWAAARTDDLRREIEQIAADLERKGRY